MTKKQHIFKQKFELFCIFHFNKNNIFQRKFEIFCISKFVEKLYVSTKHLYIWSVKNLISKVILIKKVD